MATNPTEISRSLEMQEIENQYRESTDIDQNNNLGGVLERTPDGCIYRIPPYLRKINEEAYTPKVVSIGPLHYGRKELIEMEKQKKIYQSKFRDRVSTQQWEEFVTYIKEKEHCIRNHYLVTSDLLSSEYVDMILCDTVFIIELFGGLTCDTYDGFLHNLHLLIHLRIDLLLLENQLPYFVLDDLYTKAFGNKDYSFFDLSIMFFGGVMALDWSYSVPLEAKHFTDLLRHVLVKDVELESENSISDLPNATKLNESGLRFKGIKGKCMLDIDCVRRDSCWKWLPCYKVYEVQIPCIKVCNETELLLRNMMALESFHYPMQTYICHYANLMDHLIDTAKDIDLLVEKEVITNCVGNPEAIVKMFNSLCLHITMSPSCYYKITKKMKTHYNYPLNHVKTTLKNVYFSNLWTGTATVAATFLLIFTLIQTICSIIQIHQGYTKK